MTRLQQLIQAAQTDDIDRLRSLLEQHPDLVSQKDESGATALHYAALNGHRRAAELLIERGADINSRDSQFEATPAGWAIEYLREKGALLGIEISDLKFAIERGDSHWVARLLARFPTLRTARDANGTSLEQLGCECANPDIRKMFLP
jgi:ankyrin repeat protein